MARRTVVMDGMRSPSETMPDRDPAAEAPVAQPAVAGLRRFKSRIRNYMLTGGKAFVPRMVSGTNTVVMEEKQRVHQFADFRLEQRDPQVIADIEASQHYGLGKDMWDADQEFATYQEEEFLRLETLVNARPDFRAKLLRTIDKDTFPLGSPEPPAATT